MDGNFSEDSLDEIDQEGSAGDSEADEESDDDPEREAMLADLRSMWEERGRGAELSDVLEQMAEVASRPATARPCTGGEGLTPMSGIGQGVVLGLKNEGSVSEVERIENSWCIEAEDAEDDWSGEHKSFLEDLDDVLAVRPPTANGRHPENRPASSLGGLADQTTARPVTARAVTEQLETVREVPSPECRPRTPFDKHVRGECMQKIRIAPVEVSSRPYTPRTGLARKVVTPRGINALVCKRGLDKPSTPFTANQREPRPCTAGDRCRLTAAGSNHAAGGSSESTPMDTDELPDAKGTETHSESTDMWVRDEEEPNPEPETLAGVEAAHDMEGSTTFEPGGGTCTVVSKELIGWMGSDNLDAPPPTAPRTARTNSSEGPPSSAGSCQFASAAARALLLDEPSAAPAEEPVLSSRPIQPRQPPRTNSSHAAPRTSGRRESLQLDCALASRPLSRASRPGSRGSAQSSVRGGKPPTAEGKRRPVTREEPPNTLHCGVDREASLDCGVDREPSLDFKESKSRHRAPHKVERTLKENIPSCSPLGRDIGGDTRERAEQLEAQEREVARSRQLASSLLLSST